MKTNYLQLSALFLLLVAVLAPLSGCGTSYGFDNKVVSTGESQLTIVDKQGMRQETHQVADDAAITLNGQPADLADLATGDAVDVIVEKRGDQEVATVIRAKSESSPGADKQSAEATPTPPAALGEQQTEPRPEDAGLSDAAATAVALDGAIANIDLPGNVFVVKEASGDEQEVTVDAKTKYTLDGEEATWESMRVGYHAKVVAERRSETILATAVDGTTQ